MQFTPSTLAVFGLATIANAHMKMATPKPYGESTLNNSPLLADGSDFPCKQRSGVYDAEGASNSFALGSKQPLSFIGSATHGGGSCQISITYDKAPTKNSVFKVIQSYVGGCPIEGVAGNNGDDANAADPSTYSFTIPDNLPAGDATLAWTWFNKIGNREMYMNCAPVTLTGGSSKRDDLETRNYTQLAERDQAAFNALPDMFVANVGNGCSTVDSADLAFPDPGSEVQSLGLTTATPSAPAGTCPTAVAAVGGSSGAAAPAATSAASPDASTAATIPGGVFATTAGASTPTTLATSASPAASTPDASPVATEAATSAAPATPASTGTTGSGAALSGACTTEGMWNCIGGTSFQQCASGAWSVVQQLAAGTKCTPGQSTAIDIAAEKKRAIRFSSPHVRRHLNHAS